MPDKLLGNKIKDTQLSAQNLTSQLQPSHPYIQEHIQNSADHQMSKV